jgi:uncharacterized lipoprotein YddW (UPF0748 family)
VRNFAILLEMPLVLCYNNCNYPLNRWRTNCMRKFLHKIIAAALACAGLLTAACAQTESEAVKIVNAESYGGLDFADYNGENAVSSTDFVEETRGSQSASDVTTATYSVTESTFAVTETAEIVTEIAESVTESGDTSPITETAAPETTTTTTTAAPETTITTAEITTTEPIATAAPQQNEADELRAVWVSYIELAAVLQGADESIFRTRMGKMLDDMLILRTNAVMVHVRAFSDALYRSDFYPWSRFAAGEIGSDPGYDPLAVIIDEADRRGIAVYAWVNPMRAENLDLLPIDTAGDRAPKEGNYYYLNPAYVSNRDLIAAGAAEIVSRYNVAGVVIDDYFYPTRDEDFDAQSYALYGDGMSLDDFRFANATAMVKAMRDAIKAADENAQFIIAPQGGVQNNYDICYADVAKWAASTDYCDIMMPQMYFGFENPWNPFDAVLTQWQGLIGGGVKLAPALAAYKIGVEEQWSGDGKDEWQTSGTLLSRQVQSIQAAGCAGFSLYSYSFLFDEGQMAGIAVDEVEALTGV